MPEQTTTHDTTTGPARDGGRDGMVDAAGDGIGAAGDHIDAATDAASDKASETYATMWHRLAEEYQWTHTLLGLGGNAMFFVGSVLFLWESSKTAGVWLFIVGSLLMLLGSIGSALVQTAD